MTVLLSSASLMQWIPYQVRDDKEHILPFSHIAIEAKLLTRS